MLSNLLDDFWPKTENEVSHEIIGAALDLHGQLGPGLPESAYECALMFELIQRGLDVRCQVPMPLMYKSVKLDQGYRLGLLINFNSKLLKHGIHRVANGL